MAPPFEDEIQEVNVQPMISRLVFEVTLAEIAPPYPLLHVHRVKVDEHTSDCPSVLKANTAPSPDERVMLLKVQLLINTECE